MRSFRALGLALAMVVLVVPAAAAQIPAPDDDLFYAVPAGVGAMPDGALIRWRTVTATALSIPMPARAWQVLYKTVDNTGTPTATVTTIMVPDVPWGGPGPRPVVSYQTAEDGAGTKCAPSFAIRGGLQALSNSTPETLLMLGALQRGWIVVAPDYQGPRSMFLGAEGEARGVLDGLRAARGFVPAGIDPAAPVGLWGYSGGAFASTVAAQMQPRHAPDIQLAGVALGGVPADVRETIKAFSGSAFGGALIMGFVTVDRAYPEFELTQYLNERALQAMARSQTDCITDAAVKHPLGSLEQYMDDPSVIDGPQLRPMFERINPLTFPGVPDAPVYEYHAQADQLAPIGPARKLIDRFCRAGVPVLAVEDRLTEHLGLIFAGAPGAMAYLADRFAGRPAPSSCGAARDPVPPAAEAAACSAPRARVTGRSVRARGRAAIVTVRGRAARGRCAPSPSAGARVSAVTVSIARLTGRRCAFLSVRGRLGAPRSCRRPTWLPARGTSNWTLRRRAVLRPGRYRIDVRATDSGGRRQGVVGRPGARFRVR